MPLRCMPYFRLGAGLALPLKRALAEVFRTSEAVQTVLRSKAACMSD